MKNRDEQAGRRGACNGRVLTSAHLPVSSRWSRNGSRCAQACVVPFLGSRSIGRALAGSPSPVRSEQWGGKKV
jgi:hypothetical protein